MTRWFLRKAVSFGPLRFNLSKRGVGASFGVKGARIGVDASGRPYAAGGRSGVYFKERLGRPTHHETPAELPGEEQQPSPATSRSSSSWRWWLLVLFALFVGVGLGVWLVGVILGVALR